MTVVVPLLREGFAAALEMDPGLHVVGQADGGDEGLRLARELEPDVIVLDLRMPGQSGLDVLRRIAAERLPVKSVVLTAAVRDNEVMEAVKLGAMGVVLKESPPEALVD